MMMIDTAGRVTAADIAHQAAQAIFGQKLINNVFRGYVAEAIVAAALEPEWTWCSADFASCDFERPDGMRLEVKQSAVLQSWSTKAPTRITGSFDVTARQGYWDGLSWVAEPGRRAHLYVLAHHLVIDDSADHRDLSQWLFYVLPATQLPPIKTISIGSLQRLTSPCSFDALHAQVSAVAASVQ